jgi:hypothetical protein
VTLEDIEIPPSVEFAQAHALVFDPPLGVRLAELHAQHCRPDCFVVPRELTNGRLALGCDLLLAIEPGGWLHEMWEAADKEVLLPAVEIIPWDEIVLVQPDEPPSP